MAIVDGEYSIPHVTFIEDIRDRCPEYRLVEVTGHNKLVAFFYPLIKLFLEVFLESCSWVPVVV